MKPLTTAAALLLFAATLALAGGRLLPFSPLADAKKGEGALYRLEILDANGKPASKSEKRYDVDAVELGTVKIGKLELADDADAPEIVKALRLLPPGTPLDGMTVKAESVALPKGKAEGVHLSLRAKIGGGSTEVVFDAWFVKDVPVFGLVRAKTKIVGGGAGESVWEVVDWKAGE